MSRLMLFLTVLLTLNSAFAASTVGLPAKRLVMGGDGKTPARYDLTAELKKKNVAKDARLVNVSVKAKAGATGATVGLMMGSEVVDSTTIVDDQEITFTLEGDSAGAAPWVLAVRGELQISEINVTLDGPGATPAPQPQPKPQPQPVEPKPAPKPQPQPAEPKPQPQPQPQPLEPKPQPQPLPQPVEPKPVEPKPAPKPQPNLPADDLRPGQAVIAISRNSGRIEMVEIVRRDMDGTYTVTFDGEEYGGWGRSQIAVTVGCGSGYCIGQNAQWVNGLSDSEVRVIGLMNNGQLVIEVVGTDDRAVVNAADLSRNGRPRRDDMPRPRRPLPGSGRHFTPGQMAYVVDGATNRVTTAQITGSGPGGVSVRLSDGRMMVIDEGSGRLAAASGCNRRVCTGQSATTYDANRRPWEVVVMGIQSDDFVVVREVRTGQTIGNWPAAALQVR